MDSIVDESYPNELIRQIESLYNEAINTDDVTRKHEAQFNYAYALIKSEESREIRKGISLLEDLCYVADQTDRRDYLYYIAIGQTRLKKYNLALDCVEEFLRSEPENHQAKELRNYINKKLTKEGLTGFAIAGGAAALIIGLFALAKSK